MCKTGPSSYALGSKIPLLGLYGFKHIGLGLVTAITRSRSGGPVSPIFVNLTLQTALNRLPDVVGVTWRALRLSSWHLQTKSSSRDLINVP